MCCWCVPLLSCSDLHAHTSSLGSGGRLRLHYSLLQSCSSAQLAAVWWFPRLLVLPVGVCRCSSSSGSASPLLPLSSLLSLVPRTWDLHADSVHRYIWAWCSCLALWCVGGHYRFPLRCGYCWSLVLVTPFFCLSFSLFRNDPRRSRQKPINWRVGDTILCFSISSWLPSFEK